MSEQMMAAMPLGICNSAHATNPFPMEIRKNPPIACRIMCDLPGNFALPKVNMKIINTSPAMTCRIPIKRKGGKCSTAIRRARYVVPQMIQIAINAK
jgi:hypothetical protein